MELRLVNDLDEPVVIEPGESIDLGYTGDYVVEEDSSRVMSTRKTTITIARRIDDE